MGDDTPVFPGGRNGDFPPVGAHMVVLFGHQGRIVAKMPFPGIAGTGIDGVAVALFLPHPRHGHEVPAAVVVVFTVEVLRPVLDIPDPMKFPQSVQTQIVVRLLRTGCPGSLLGSIGKKGCVHVQPVQVVDFGPEGFRGQARIFRQLLSCDGSLGDERCRYCRGQQHGNQQ